MPIDPKIEEPTRDLLGHVIRGEFKENADVIESIGPQRLLQCISLCLRVSGYIVIDICRQARPTYGDLHRIAEIMSGVDLDFDLAESDVYDYLARGVLAFEPLIEVFPDKEKAGTIPFLVTAALLVSYRTDGKHWWEYLNAIETALETAASLPEDVVPALLLLTRRNRALKERGGAGGQAS
jgi:hypothetical protein